MKLTGAAKLDAPWRMAKFSSGKEFRLTVKCVISKNWNYGRAFHDGRPGIPRSKRVLRAATERDYARRVEEASKGGVRRRQHMTCKCLIDRGSSRVWRPRRPSKLLGCVDDSAQPGRRRNPLIRRIVPAELKTARKALVALFDGRLPCPCRRSHCESVCPPRHRDPETRGRCRPLPSVRIEIGYCRSHPLRLRLRRCTDKRHHETMHRSTCPPVPRKER